MSPALAGRLLTTGPPGKPSQPHLIRMFNHSFTERFFDSYTPQSAGFFLFIGCTFSFFFSPLVFVSAAGLPHDCALHSAEHGDLIDTGSLFVLKKQMTISFHKNRFLARKICLKKRHILIISLLICTALGEKK